VGFHDIIIANMNGALPSLLQKTPSLWRRPLAGNAGVPAGVEPDGGRNAAMAG
jgi:hypothetical protein